MNSFFDADRRTGEDRAEFDLFTAPTNAAAMGHDKSLVVKRVIDIWQSLVSTRRRLIDLHRALQSFVRPFVVVDFVEIIKLGLLLKKVGSSGLAGLFLIIASELYVRSCSG
jgi:hypothetical protein